MSGFEVYYAMFCGVLIYGWDSLDVRYFDESTKLSCFLLRR